MDLVMRVFREVKRFHETVSEIAEQEIFLNKGK